MRMYFIALVLPEELNRQVKALKEYMRDHYGSKAALRSPAHITIVPPFWMDESLSEKLAGMLDEVASRLTAFEIAQAGFASFPPKTIFIAAKQNEQLSALHRTVVTFFRELSTFPMKFDERLFHPHVTIATRDLTKKAYHEAWQHFENKRFEVTWTCHSISLLELSETGWRVLHSAAFGNNSV